MESATESQHGGAGALASETVPIGSLVPDPANVRKHSGKNIDAIKGSLLRFGQQRPILVGPSGVVIAGNGTLAAAKALGWESIAVTRTALAGAEATAYAIADNRTAELAEWDDEALAKQLSALEIDDEALARATGFDEKELRRIVDSVTEVTEDDVPPVPVDPVTKPGDLWLLGDHRLLCGDSTNAEDVARVMGGDIADCVFTSPPYAVGVDYGSTYEDTIENLRESLPKLAHNWNVVVADGGYAVVNFGDIVSAKSIVGTDEPCEYPMALEYWPVFRNKGWLLWSRRAWCKPGAGTGSLQCVSSNRAATNWEHVWTWKRPGKPLHDSQTTGEYASQNGWFDSTHSHKLGVGLSEHGAGMPVMVAAFGIAVHARVGAVVHEPFMGTGTTMIAAEQLGRRCYGIEISPAYCDVTVRRWEKLTGRTATLAQR